VANSKCPKCDAGAFISEDYMLPVGEEIVFVQCAACGTVVGVLEKHGIADVVEGNQALLMKIAEKLGITV
jgi:hypothetical protein